MTAQRPGPVVVGVDLGTSGVRVLAVTRAGQVVAAGGASLRAARLLDQGGRHEQDPFTWWDATCEALGEAVAALKAAGVGPEQVEAVAVDGTSGTLVCLDAGGTPLRPALMYNDGRAAAEAEALNERAGAFCERMGHRFAASYALAKIEWLRSNEPEVFARTAVFLHQGDYVESRLCGGAAASDYSNALKTGYDLLEERWPAWIEGLEGVRSRLPEVAAPGVPVGRVCPAAAAVTGLGEGTLVVAGATDGTAACVASGVRSPGQYNTTLGTTLVFKGVSRQPVRHPQGLIYSHKLPSGMWLPGAASNTGCEWIEAGFADRDLAELDRAAAGRLPVPEVAYPLARRGERFPFLAPDARGFCIPEAPDEAGRYAARLQGTALVERLAYEVMDGATGAGGGEVFSTGGGSRSDVWMQCRADVTGRLLHRPAVPESAFGSAVLAASAVWFSSVWEAVAVMVRLDRSFAPEPSRRPQADEAFALLCAELDRRGWR
ncbi:MAG: FGGY-family carbohydrate kinase [Candidatus Latescibacterota bacterium]